MNQISWPAGFSMQAYIRSYYAVLRPGILSMFSILPCY